jgi:hypothetical protein
MLDGGLSAVDVREVDAGGLRGVDASPVTSFQAGRFARTPGVVRAVI